MKQRKEVLMFRIIPSGLLAVILNPLMVQFARLGLAGSLAAHRS